MEKHTVRWFLREQKRAAALHHEMESIKRTELQMSGGTSTKQKFFGQYFADTRPFRAMVSAISTPGPRSIERP
jgi:hypothetical protein